ncbi:MAG: HEAT repeat domain-containing protein [Deltaproteobacteria bacterium]|nr:HEAT repeat domain-containing protein [Deltaproteobacteria bacterium]
MASIRSVTILAVMLAACAPAPPAESARAPAPFDDEVASMAVGEFASRGDPRAVQVAIEILKKGGHAARAKAALALAQLGPAQAEPARTALLRSLDEAAPADERQIAWALAVLKESKGIDRLFTLLETGKITDPIQPSVDKLIASLPADVWIARAKHPSPAVRLVVARALAPSTAPSARDALALLAEDTDSKVSREALQALRTSGDARVCKPMIARLPKANAEERTSLITALRDMCGGRGLVTALPAVDVSIPIKDFQHKKAIFEALRELTDPRAADPLVEYLLTKPSMHWYTEAAMRLAELGDVRAAPYLAERLRHDPIKLYGESKLDQERMLARSDEERVLSARLLSDLVVLHPDRREWLLAQAEDAVIAWLKGQPSPHANGMRFVALAGSPKGLLMLRAWAFPSTRLPLPGAQPPFPQDWATAQSALRYIGVTKDAASWPRLQQQLLRRRAEAKNADVTMNALMGGGLAMLGMSLRAVGFGTSDAFSEWGDARAVPLLRAYIEDQRENEQARQQACFALPWVASAATMIEVAKKIEPWASSSDPKLQFIASCYANSLGRRPQAASNDAALKILVPSSEATIRATVAAAIGSAGLTAPQEKALASLLQDPVVGVDAAIALLLGASAQSAAQAVEAMAQGSANRMDSLKEAYARALGFYSDEDLSSGRLGRWAENAEAASRVNVRGSQQLWVEELLVRALGKVLYDNGPHSITRTVLRYRLQQAAEGGDAASRVHAIRLLRMLRAQGTLMALRDRGGDVGTEASAALRSMQSPD